MSPPKHKYPKVKIWNLAKLLFPLLSKIKKWAPQFSKVKLTLTQTQAVTTNVKFENVFRNVKFENGYYGIPNSHKKWY